MNEQSFTDIVGYCNYCKGEIRKGERYVVDDKTKELFHTDCNQQLNTYYDPCDDIEEG